MWLQAKLFASVLLAWLQSKPHYHVSYYWCLVSYFSVSYFSALFSLVIDCYSFGGIKITVCRLVELAAESIQQEAARGKCQEDSWNASAIDLVRASDVSSAVFFVDVCLQGPTRGALHWEMNAHSLNRSCRPKQGLRTLSKYTVHIGTMSTAVIKVPRNLVISFKLGQ